jgi:uncharacterized membrane protein YvbJ
MALIPCPECRREISDKAASCPHCGCPISIPSGPATAQEPITIQETGKKYKGLIILSWAAIIFGGLLVAASGDPSKGQSGGPSVIGGILLAVGLIAWIATRFQIWWHHK